MIGRLLSGIILCVFSGCFSQDLSEKYAKYIDTSDIKRHISVLAADSLEGRATAQTGQKKAAVYIKEQFRVAGCSPLPGAESYSQEFKLLKKQKSGTLRWNGRTLSYPFDFGFNGLYQPWESNTGEVYYAGSLTSLKNRKDLDAFSDKIWVIEMENNEVFDKELAGRIRAKAVLFLVHEYTPDYFVQYDTSGLAMVQQAVQQPYIFLDAQALSKRNLQQLRRSENGKVSLKIDLNTNASYVSTENVLAFVEGSDSLLKSEVIVLSAHYDHLGIKNGQVYNGADDNGTGTAALLEIAQAFEEARKEGNNPKRSYVFMAMTGEELGLFGSFYYTEHPLIPLENTITDLNIDMIGRPTKESEKDTFSVYVIGSDMLSSDLHRVQKQANQQFTHLDLDYTYNDVMHPLKLYYRSDHYNFAKNSIPSIFYFGGFHDDYHQPGDDAEKINAEKVKQITQLVFHTAWLLGNAPKRPALNR